MLLWLVGWSPAHAEAEIQLRTLLPVVMLVDGERARRTGPFKLRAADLEPGTHNVQIKSLLGRLLYEESIELVDDTVVEAEWQNRVLRVRSVTKDGQPFEVEVPVDGPELDGGSASGIHAVEAEGTEPADPWPDTEEEGPWPDAEEEGPWPDEVAPEEEPPVVRVTKPGEPAPEALSAEAPGAEDAVAAVDVAVDQTGADPSADVVEAAAELVGEAADVDVGVVAAAADDVAPTDPSADVDPSGEEIAAAGEDEVSEETVADEVADEEAAAPGEGTEEVAEAEAVAPGEGTEEPAQAAAEEPAAEPTAAEVADAPQADAGTAEALEVAEATTAAEAPEAASPGMRLSLEEGSRIELVHEEETVWLEVRDGRIVVTDSAGLVLGAE